MFFIGIFYFYIFVIQNWWCDLLSILYFYSNLKFLLNRVATTDDTSDIKGIPDFWLTILKNTSLISDMIQPHDEPILSHLTDVKVYLLEEPMVIFLIMMFDYFYYFLTIFRVLLWNSIFLVMNGSLTLYWQRSMKWSVYPIRMLH